MGRVTREVAKWASAATLLAALASVPMGRPAVEAAPAPNSASELIAEVNALRAANGMGPLNVDPILMSIAQAQNNYSMSIGQITHTGPNGSRPKERAIAAGYGGGATVFVSENIAQGTGLTPAEAVQWWTGDDPHWNTMMGANYRDIGAGAACDGSTCYYTIDTGYVAGGISANSTAPAAVQAPAAQSGAMPVLQATPMPDGSVVHTVQAGQTLWTVAAVYEIPLADLLALNGLTETSLLQVGDELLIHAGADPTPTATPARTSTPPATAISTSSTTAGATTATPGQAPPTALPDEAAFTLSLTPAQWLLGLLGLGLLVTGIYFASRRTPEAPPPPPSGISRVFRSDGADDDPTLPPDD